MISFGGKLLHWLAIFFALWALAIAIVDVYYFSKLGNSSFVLTSRARTTLIVLNAVTIGLGAILVIYAIVHMFMGSGSSDKDAACGMVIKKPTCGMPMPPAKIACGNGMPAPKSPCAEKIVRKSCFDASMIHKGIEKLKCYIGDLEQQEVAVRDELSQARSELQGVCNMSAGILSEPTGRRTIGRTSPRGVVAEF